MNEPEWSQLVSGLIDGTLPPADQEKLRDFLQRHPEKEDELVSSLLAERLLPVALATDAGESTAEEVLYRLHPETAAAIPFPAVRKPSPLRFIIPAAAAITLGFIGWFINDRTRPMGWLSRSESIVWSSAVPSDGKLTRGNQLSASSGLAEIELRNGARILLEAPFSIDLESPKNVTLHSGRLAAHCPPTAKGFTIETPRGKVVDLGTELGVSVDGKGLVEAHVLNGSIEVDEVGSSRKFSLFGGEAIRMDKRNTRRVTADPSAFVTRMPFLDEGSGGFVHWSMDEALGDFSADAGSGLAEGESGDLALGADPLNTPSVEIPQWIPGIRGSALSFDGKGSFAESTYRGIEGALPRTVALWIRVADPQATSGAGILSWGSVMEDSAWQISLNWTDHDGPTGRLRIGTFAGHIIGTTQLRDGKWHHIAVVMYPQTRPDDAVNVLLYVDGKLEPISVRSNFRVNTNTRLAAHGVTLGRHVSSIGNSRRFFHGDMDDVFIFGRALMQEQIQQIMKGETSFTR